MKIRSLPNWLRLALPALVLVAAGPAGAIVTRHDRDDRAFRELGGRYPAAVGILPDGTGVLIAPDWVLTAAHVARGVADRSPRVQLDDREIGVERIVLHPGWRDMGAHDIALLKLSKPAEGVRPVSLYAKDDEVGQVVTLVGRGDHGTGLTGPETMDRVKRGATNRVVDADDDWLFFTFDRGDAATDLEGVSGPGDSGGPALVTVEGATYTLGVSVFADGGPGPGRYGVREGYTRVSTHRAWIESVLAGTSGDAGFAPGEGPRRGSRVRVAGPETGGTSLPEAPAGRLVAGYLEAYNSNDAATMSRFIAAHFTKTLREKRSETEHLALYRRLYDELFGTLAVSRIREATDDAITVLLQGERGSMGEFRFEIEGESDPKIAALRVALVEIDGGGPGGGRR